MPHDDDRPVDLRNYLDAVRRRKRTVAAFALGVVAVTVAYTFTRTPLYEGKARVLVLPRSAEAIFGGAQARASLGTVETEIEVLRSDPVRSRVTDRLTSASNISGRQIGDTDIMQIIARHTDARRAASIANAYAEAYVDFRKSEAVAELSAAAEGIKAKIRDLQEEADGLERRIAQAPPADRNAVEATVRPRYTNVLAQQSSLSQKLDQVEVDMALKRGGAQIVGIATPAKTPATPKPVRNAVAGLVMGLLCGAGVAYVQENLDDSVKTKDELAGAAGLPVLGVIPTIQSWTTTTADRLVIGDGDFAGPEALRRLRTSVQLLGVERPIQTLQFTSPNPGDGKTSLIVGLGMVFAQAGQRVVIVDCDLRRPQLHSVFGVSNDDGFMTVFDEKMALLEAVRPSGKDYPLYVLTSGPLPPNPSEVLGSKRTATILYELQGEFDLVLVDSPPVLPVTDSTLLAAWVEGTVVVAKAGVTTKKQITEAVSQLSTAQATVLGTVLNQARHETAYGYSYKYY